MLMPNPLQLFATLALGVLATLALVLAALVALVALVALAAFATFGAAALAVSMCNSRGPHGCTLMCTQLTATQIKEVSSTSGHS